MSGIAGVYYLDGRPLTPSTIETMLSRIAHRGPDGHGIWCRGSVGMGHCMLWTTPESVHERQPKLNSAADLILTADARIDNREELIRSLGLVSPSTQTITDGQIILGAYERWKSDCPAKLVGDFAFTIWDAREQLLFCARDPVGARPFYYYHAPGCFAFASEIKALLTLKDVPNRLNETQLAHYLSLQFEDGESTFFQGIFRLQAAHACVIDTQGKRARKYWSLDPQREIVLKSNEEYVLAFREVFAEAVACRLRSYSAVGTTLSGGLDSSSIACTARQILFVKNKLPLNVFSAVYPNLPQPERSKIDEKYYIEQVLATGGFDQHFVPVDQSSPFIELDPAIPELDEPYFAPTMHMFWAIYLAAHQAGVRVLLDGTDGDRTVSHGLEYLDELARYGKWKTLIGEARALSHNTNGSSSTGKIIWQHAVKPMLPDDWLRIAHRLRGGPKSTGPNPSLINPELARRTGLAEQLAYHPAQYPLKGKTARRLHWQELNTALIPLSLELFDAASVRFSLEIRYPFFDRRLLEFCLALPADQKLSAGWTRAILRRSMEGGLPAEIQHRTSKANLMAGLGTRLLACEQPRMERVFMSDPSPLSDYVDIPALRKLYRRFVDSPEVNQMDGYLIYSMLILGSWLIKHEFSG